MESGLVMFMTSGFDPASFLLLLVPALVALLWMVRLTRSSIHNGGLCRRCGHDCWYRSDDNLCYHCDLSDRKAA